MAAPLPPPTTQPSPSDDATYYTWSSFFSILSGSATTTERAAYFRTKDIVNEERDIARADADMPSCCSASSMRTRAR